LNGVYGVSLYGVGNVTNHGLIEGGNAPNGFGGGGIYLTPNGAGIFLTQNGAPA
jgi:hypothetical protein